MYVCLFIGRLASNTFELLFTGIFGGGCLTHKEIIFDPLIHKKTIALLIEYG
jgi:hypothetical protein